MPEQELPPNEDLATSEDLTPAARGSWLAKVKILSFVTVVIAVECVAAYLYLPTAADTAALAEATLGTTPTIEKPPEEAEKPKEEQELADQVEVDLGEFSVTAFQPVSNTTLRIDFHLYGTVGAEDEQTFLALMNENLHRFREQVIVTVRSADITDLTDAGLGLVKRKILEKTNRIMGKPLLRVVIFSDFSFIEQ
ncbi:MAG: hypothetical protein JXB62_21045 [Pirellulales bacterium]|nr:hypothetical protein [Pirellulales bacterium]